MSSANCWTVEWNVQCLVVWLHFWQLGKLWKTLLIKVKVPRLWWCQTARRSRSMHSDEHVVCDNILAVPDHKLLPILRCQVTILGTIRWTSKFHFSDCFYGSDRRQNIPVSTSVRAVHVVCITDSSVLLAHLSRFWRKVFATDSVQHNNENRIHEPVRNNIS